MIARRSSNKSRPSRRNAPTRRGHPRPHGRSRPRNRVLASLPPPPQILLVDLETSPNQGFTWSKYETDVIEFTQPWVILSVAWQWYGQEKVHTKGLCDYPG